MATTGTLFDLDRVAQGGLTARERQLRMPTSATPTWARGFAAVYNRSDERLAGPPGLLRAVLPLAELSRLRVRATIAKSRVAPGDAAGREALIGSLEASLFARLFEAASRTLVRQLGAAQARGLLAGETAEERFAFFCECLGDRRFAAGLLAQYPALVRRLSTVIRSWESAARETAERLAGDFARLRYSLFDGEDPGAWTAAEALGDAHRRGRTVQRLTFASGSSLIYKPRTLAMEHGFFDLVEWLNAAGLRPDLAAAPALDRGSYGWTRWVAPAPCRDEAAVAAYFRRQGGNLALAYLLGIADLHFENVIAAGEYPVIVDLEAAFHDAPKPFGPGRATRAATRAMHDSVIRTLLLPIYIEDEVQADGERLGGDPSALGFPTDTDGEYFAEGWDGAGTDAMRLARVRSAMPAAACLPELAGLRIVAAPYVETIVAGFEGAYDFLMGRRDDLARPGGPLDAFLGGRARRVLRATRTYVRLLNRTWHPRFGEDADALAADIQVRLVELSPHGPPASVRAKEARDLFRGDVPYFTVPVGPPGGWRACQRRLAALSNADKATQAWIVRMTLVDYNKPLRAMARTQRDGAEADVIEAAVRQVGDRLCDLAFVRGRRASWLYPQIDGGLQFSPAPLAIDLYDGLAGVALFLGGLAAMTGVRRYSSVAEAALAEALDLAGESDPELTYIGAHRGVAGLAWTLAVLGRLRGHHAWLNQAVEILRLHVDAVPSDPQIDLISGRAGFLAAGLAVAEMADDPPLAAALRPCAENLLALPESALPAEEDAGMGHGKAGIGFALAQWAKSGGDEPARERGLALIRSDLEVSRSARLGARLGWDDEDGRAMLAWCRGGLGAAHAALQLGHPAMADSETLIRAVALRMSAEIEIPMCPCHGALGILEFLSAAQDAAIEGAAEASAALRADVIGRISNGEYCANHYDRIESPGLMMGLAGAGWSLLRMLEPSRFPSALTLGAA